MEILNIRHGWKRRCGTTFSLSTVCDGDVWFQTLAILDQEGPSVCDGSHILETSFHLYKEANTTASLQQHDINCQDLSVPI